MDYSLASPNTAHTYGNVAAFVTEYVKQLFPDRFKTTYISTTIAYRNFSRFTFTGREFIKKRKPFLLVRPRIETNLDDTFLSNTYFTTRMIDTVNPREWGNLQEFIIDKKRGLYMKFLLNRLVMSFDITLVFDTQLQQINYYNYFRNRVRQNAPFTVSTNLESMLPRDMVILLCKMAGLEAVEGDEMKVPEIIKYLNQHACYPVTYKIKNSTGRDEFFRYYPANIELTFSDLSVDEGSKTNQVSGSFGINFTVRSEFSTAGLYYLFNANEGIEDKYRNLTKYNYSDDQNTCIIPSLTIKDIINYKLPDDWNLYMCPMFDISPKDPVPYVLSLEQLFNNSLMACVKYHKAHNIPVSTFLHVVCFKDNRLMSKERKEYEILWDDDVSIKVYNVNSHSTYRLVIGVNTGYINTLVANLYDIKDEK